MSDKLKIVVADDEEVICTMLTKIIDFEGLGLELVGSAMDGETLMDLIETEHPDIVVTDISMPKADGLKVVATAHQQGIRCKFIIISGYTQFEYAYNALKYDVKDYILKPIDKDELNLALRKTVSELSAEGEREDYSTTLHSFFMRNVVAQPRDTLMSIASVNETYSLQIRDGEMRVLFLRLDFPGQRKRAEEDVTSVMNKLLNLLQSHLAAVCDEHVLEQEYFRVTAFLNYKKVDEQRIVEEIHKIFLEAKNVVGIFAGMTVTVCVGSPVCDINKLHQSYLNAMHAMWLRRAVGTGRVIFYDAADGGLTPELDDRLSELEKSFEKGLTGLDSYAVTQTLDALFAMPRETLRKEAVRLLVWQMIDAIAEKVDEMEIELADLGDCKAMLDEMRKECAFTSTFEGLQDVMKFQVRNILFRIKKCLERKPFSPIRGAYQYIEKNYAKPISLNEIAEAVNLSPAYFSVLFKKETGVSLMDYIADVRINKAKEYLRDTDMNVNEIAYALSFQDARYFSKLFKKKVGIKPSEYRKIYG